MRLFDCPDLLALGWLANREREKRHGARTYYNFNIRLEATNVCVASCLFCSFARLQPGDPGSYTMSLEQAWDKLRQRAASAADRSPRRQRAAPRSAVRLLPGDAARLQAHPSRHSPEVLHRRRDCVLRGSLRHDRRAGAARAAGRPGSTRCPAAARRFSPSACAGRSVTTSAARIAISRSTARARPGDAHQHHDAVRAHRDERRTRRPHAARAGVAGRQRRVSGVHPARVPPRQQSDAEAAGAQRDRHAARASPSRG